MIACAPGASGSEVILSSSGFTGWKPTPAHPTAGQMRAAAMIAGDRRQRDLQTEWQRADITQPHPKRGVCGPDRAFGRKKNTDGIGREPELLTRQFLRGTLTLSGVRVKEIAPRMVRFPDLSRRGVDVRKSLRLMVLRTALPQNMFLKAQNRNPARTMEAGRVSTQAMARLRTVDHCKPEWL